MFDTNYPEAFSEEYAEYEKLLCKQAVADAQIASIWMGFGFDEETAFRFAMEETPKPVYTDKELLSFFPPSR